MSKVFNFNNFNLSSDEVINYAANGVLSTIPANVFLSIIREYEEKLEQLEITLEDRDSYIEALESCEYCE